MKVLILTPWKNAWLPLYRRVFEERGHEVKAGAWPKDGKPEKIVRAMEEFAHHGVILHMWAAPWPGPGRTSYRCNPAAEVVFLRRFELFSKLEDIRWYQAKRLFVCNTWIAEQVYRMADQIAECSMCDGDGERIGWSQEMEECENCDGRGHLLPKIELVYNGVDLDAWTYREREHGTSIGMACHIHPKKNLPLALQILAVLPDDFTLHIAGACQDEFTRAYLDHLGRDLRRRIYLYDQIPHEEMDGWWEQHNYCLSTSISEGNPNNVNEALAKGIRPVVHAWPGARDQYGDYVFETVEEAAQMILEDHGTYDSAACRALAAERFDYRKNFGRVAEIVEEVCREQV